LTPDPGWKNSDPGIRDKHPRSATLPSTVFLSRMCCCLDELTATELAEELVEKLEFFKVNQEKISNLKLTAVKIEVSSCTPMYGSTVEFTDPEYLDLLEEKIFRNLRNFTLEVMKMSPRLLKYCRYLFHKKLFISYTSSKMSETFLFPQFS
jgi:hypothetical protein